MAQVDELEGRLLEAGNNLLKLGAIIGEFHIRNDEIETPEQARKVIVSFIDDLKGQHNENTNNLESRTESLLDFLRKEREYQLESVQLYEKAIQELNYQSNFIKCNLKMQCSDFENEMIKRKESLEKGNLRILITGEICAGKSSILNMLMGGQYMPVGHGPCTMIPCEVQQSKIRRAVLWYEEARYRTREIELVNDEKDSVWSQIRECVETGQDKMFEREQRSNEPLKKIVVYWNMQILNDIHQTQRKGICTNSTTDHDQVIEGITFVDAPGIHDTEQTFASIHEYIHDCDAFLFVVNTSQHDGVDKDRLIRLMIDVQDSLQRKHNIFTPKCALFICNKWDRVEDDIKTNLKKTILTKLQSCWSRVTEKQMVTFNGSSQILKSVQQKYYSDEYTSFFKGICGFVETVARLKTETHCWWLSTFIDRTFAIVCNVQAIIHRYKKDKEKVQTQIQKDIDKIVQLQTKRDEIEKCLTERLNQNTEKVKTYLQKDLKENKDKLKVWYVSDIPRQESHDWQSYSWKINETIGSKIEKHILKNCHIESVRKQCNTHVDSILNQVIMLYAGLENELTFMQPIRDDKLNQLVERMSKSPYELTWQEIAGVVVAVVFPLAPIVVFLIDAIDSVRSPTLLNDEELFTKDCYDYMKKQTEILVENILSSRLQNVSTALLDSQIKNSRFVLKYFQECLNLQVQMLQELAKEIQSYKLEVHRKLELQQLSDDIQKFLIGNILRPEVDQELVRFDACPSNTLGEGSFGKVYKATCLGDLGDKDVAVKEIRYPRDGNCPDDTYIYRECFNLRMLSVKPANVRENIIEYYGEFVTVNTTTFSLHMVMELCDGSLNSLIQNNTLLVPWCSEKDLDFPGRDQSEEESIGYIMNLAEQAAMGIAFLHDNNIVHRDIKPHNVLIKYMKKSTRVKICDFGLSRDQNLVKTRRYVGTVNYNAPEVLAADINTFASDIYSFGLVVWELWYGERVFEDLSLADISNKNRKAPKLKNIQPPEPLKKLLTVMWKRNQEARPNSHSLVTQLRTLRKQYKQP